VSISLNFLPYKLCILYRLLRQNVSVSSFHRPLPGLSPLTPLLNCRPPDSLTPARPLTTPTGWLTITGLDRTYYAHHFIFSFTFQFLFVPCGRLSWLPVSFLLHVKYPLSYCIVLAPNSSRLEPRLLYTSGLQFAFRSSLNCQHFISFCREWARREYVFRREWEWKYVTFQ